MLIPNVYGQQAEDCLELASETFELYARTALVELAAELQEKAEKLQGAAPNRDYEIR
jgi:hypothetical protein